MYYEFKYFFMNHDDISNFILDNLELYLIVTILLIIWVIKSAKKNNPNRSSSRRKKNIDDLIKNDPTLQKLDKEIGDLNKKAADRLKRDKDAMVTLIKNGIEIDREVSKFQFDKNQFLNEIKELLKKDETLYEIQDCIMNLPNEVSNIEIKKLLLLCDKWRVILDENSGIYLSEMKKNQLIEYANNKLDLKLSKSLKKQDLIFEIKNILYSPPKNLKKQIQNEIKKIKAEIYDSLIKVLKNF